MTDTTYECKTCGGYSKNSKYEGNREDFQCYNCLQKGEPEKCKTCGRSFRSAGGFDTCYHCRHPGTPTQTPTKKNPGDQIKCSQCSATQPRGNFSGREASFVCINCRFPKPTMKCRKCNLNKSYNVKNKNIKPENFTCTDCFEKAKVGEEKIPVAPSTGDKNSQSSSTSSKSRPIWSRDLPPMSSSTTMEKKESSPRTGNNSVNSPAMKLLMQSDGVGLSKNDAATVIANLGIENLDDFLYVTEDMARQAVSSLKPVPSNKAFQLLKAGSNGFQSFTLTTQNLVNMQRRERSSSDSSIGSNSSQHSSLNSSWDSGWGNSGSDNSSIGSGIWDQSTRNISSGKLLKIISNRNEEDNDGESFKSKPLCKYGKNCWRKDCYFHHPDGSIGLSKNKNMGCSFDLPNGLRLHIVMGDITKTNVE
jgi:hypothetical protein